MWSSTCQQKEEKAMPTYTQGTVTPAGERKICDAGYSNKQKEEKAMPTYTHGTVTPANVVGKRTSTGSKQWVQGPGLP